ncbi:hypothetical protein K2Y00_02110 [Patescibacteria group bacterium]|nr:hypothetical protein [Patescibacteria group bacterium]
MRTLTLTLLVLSFFVLPHGTFAASAKPSVSVGLPVKGASYDRTSKMPVTWELENVNRPMVVVTTFKLEKEDTKSPSVGYSSGSSYQHTLYAGQTTGGFTQDWGLNPTIPGKYSVKVELRECNVKGCDHAPAGKLLSKKGKERTFIVSNTAGTTLDPVSSTGTTVEIVSPNGDEEYVAGSGKKLAIKWEAEGVPKGSTVCTTLERRGAVGGMFAFPGEKSCKKAKNGKDSVSGKLIQTAGYNLAPGDYWARVTIGAKASGGKDGATLAQDISDEYFTLE